MRKASVALGLLFAFIGLPAVALAAPPACNGGYVVHSAATNGVSTLAKVNLSTGAATRVATLGWHVNAIGYAAGQNRFYGIGRQDGYHAQPHVVAIDPAGKLTDLGPTEDWFGDTLAGTVWQGRYYLMAHNFLSIMDVNPASGSYLKVLSNVLVPRALTLGDWDVDPADGTLWGVDNVGPVRAEVIRVDPATGQASGFPTNLPGGSLYGSALITPDHTLYVINNSLDNQHRTYRMSLAGGAPSFAQEIGAGEAWASSDAAFCSTAAVPGRPSLPAAPPANPPAGVPPPTYPALPAVVGPSMNPLPTVIPTPPPPITLPVNSLPRAVRRIPPAIKRTDQLDQRRWASATVIALTMCGLLGVRNMRRR